MTHSAKRHDSEDFYSDADRRKRLGQYFTGVPLARLLAALAHAERATGILDPMAGSGDMLVACWDQGARPAIWGAIEIDPAAASECRARLESLGLDGATLIAGDAFRPATLAQLPSLQWDTVITNPPYVRYQSGADAADGSSRLPGALEVRQNLLQFIRGRTDLPPDERLLFEHLTAHYSGLSDLAVPAWLLCASLVNPGGTLAMVVPESWLSRNYAAPIHYLLARCFALECIVEDGDVVWFPDALVRTNLVVARRVPLRPSAFSFDDCDGYLHVVVSGRAGNQHSIVGAAYAHSSSPEAAFAAEVEQARAAAAGWERDDSRASWVPMSHFSGALAQRGQENRWLLGVEPFQFGASPAPAQLSPPPPLISLLPDHEAEFVSLEDYGWQAGQGLRTGANQFFYVDNFRQIDEAAVLVRASHLLGDMEFEAPATAVRPVARRQSDVQDTYLVDCDRLSSRVLLLGQFIHPDDLAAAIEGGYGEVVRRAYTIMPPGVAAYVSRGATTPADGAGGRRFIPDLSAVVTNQRPYSPGRPGSVPRYWYQLPPLTSRHTAPVFLPRVNGSLVRGLLNPDGRAVIDANFSTLWPLHGAALHPDALIALLNSSWCTASLELIGTVMGGGALKVEATHLRRLALPGLDAPQIACLAEMGQRLLQDEPRSCGTVRAAIDGLIGEALGERAGDEKITDGLRRIADERLKARTG